MLALALPLLSQVIIDKVIVHRATSTLAVIAAALVAIVVFSSVLTWIRQYLVIHTGNRVDGVLGAAVFRHLLALPLRYFERRPTGVLTARLAGIETIREFLTGAAVALALDVPFLLVFLVVMLLYSVPLTLLTLAVVALLAIASALAAPLFQKRYDAQFLAAARSQAFVTEHVAAIETVKALQLEPPLGLRYESLLATYLDAGFRTRQVSNSYQTIAGALEQLLSASILCAGAWIVMTTADFTIGMLVAFQMFAARVAQPLLRLTSLWQQFQQAVIAVKRLADVMDVPAEPHCVAPTRVAQGAGRIEFAGVGFRYAPERPWLHRNLEFTVEPGECVVLTGRSGCGKSTLLKLLLGFAHPEEGAVRIDGRDTRAFGANELRARFGVVPQETTLVLRHAARQPAARQSARELRAGRAGLSRRGNPRHDRGAARRLPERGRRAGRRALRRPEAADRARSCAAASARRSCCWMSRFRSSTMNRPRTSRPRCRSSRAR